MITEDYVSFEVAKLLKERGFDIDCDVSYFNGVLVDYTMYGFCDGELINCPTHQLAMKWLREKYKIYIDIETCYTYLNKNENFEITGYEFTIHSQYEPCYEDHKTHNSYEEAVEASLKFCLESLI